MAKLITIYWRDIPAQVLGRKGRTTAVKPDFLETVVRAKGLGLGLGLGLLNQGKA